jgi:hypothetical protein
MRAARGMGGETTFDVEKSVLIEARKVTGSEPAVLEKFTHSFVFTQIFLEHIRAFQPKHSELA